MTTDLLRQGRYRIEQSLGQGAMGTVHLARDTVLGRQVAVKVLAEHLAADDVFRQRFIQESRLTARLCHPNVVQMFDAGDDGRPFLVMEYVDGETVAERLARGAGFSADEALTLAIHLSAGLAHAHEQGIVHRDVKPHNVLLRQDGVAKLTDFGIARALEDSGLTEIGTVMGTARFMAPEQAAGQPAGPPADVYALGALLRHVGAGALPPQVESLVDASLLPEPQARPSAADLHQQLVALSPEPPAAVTPAPVAPAEGELTELVLVAPTEIGPPPVTPPAVAPPMTTGSWRLGWPAIAAAAVLLVLLALFVQGLGADGERADAPQATSPVPAASDPPQTARNLATWLRDSAD
jgi:serine/threonine-protein kinase